MSETAPHPDHDHRPSTVRTLLKTQPHSVEAEQSVLGGLMLDNDSEGENGARQSLPVLAEHWPVRLIWSSTMYDGEFKGRQPESLTPEKWAAISERMTDPAG